MEASNLRSSLSVASDTNAIRACCTPAASMLPCSLRLLSPAVLPYRAYARCLASCLASDTIRPSAASNEHNCGSRVNPVQAFASSENLTTVQELGTCRGKRSLIEAAPKTNSTLSSSAPTSPRLSPEMIKSSTHPVHLSGCVPCNATPPPRSTGKKQSP